MRKPAFCICENKNADQLRGEREADHAFVFATRIVQSLYFLNTKFQASSHLVWSCSLVCVGPGRKPRRPVFSQRGSLRQFLVIAYTLLLLMMWLTFVLSVPVKVITHGLGVWSFVKSLKKV